VTICGEMLHGASVALLSWLYRTDRPTVRVKSLWGGEEKLENAWSLGVRVLGGMESLQARGFSWNKRQPLEACPADAINAFCPIPLTHYELACFGLENRQG
jgi:hypothetical protein